MKRKIIKYSTYRCLGRDKGAQKNRKTQKKHDPQKGQNKETEKY